MDSTTTLRKLEQRLQTERQEKAEREAQEARQTAERHARGLAYFQEQSAKAKADALAKREAAINASLAADKETAKRSWLAEHPGHSDEEFERVAWPHLKQNLLEARDVSAAEIITQELRATGNYRM
jgi:regulator of protease activity HflC (stomatin/prohibitin superfamily)